VTNPRSISTENDRLDAAVREGIITAEQAMAIRALAPTVGRPPRELDRPPQPTLMQASSIAYTLGAITVIAAMFWFLADNWDELGPAGALAACALYAALFFVAARVLAREGQPQAASLTVTLAVVMVGPATVALNELTGLVPTSRGDACTYPAFGLWQCRGEELLTEGAMLAAAGIALWRTRYPLLVALITTIAMRGVFHVADGVSDNTLLTAGSSWVWMICGSLTLTVAYLFERWQPRDTDYAIFHHLGAAFCALVVTLNLLSIHEWMRHLLVPTAFVAFATALLLRRFVYVPLGMFWVVWYLGWLAKDVFRNSPAFPILVAALGLAVIVATVWIQRNAAQLTARFGGVTDDGRPRFPGGVLLLLAPAMMAVVRLPDAIAEDRIKRSEQDYDARRFQRAEQRRRREAARARADSVRAGLVAPPPARPSGNPR